MAYEFYLGLDAYTSDGEDPRFAAALIEKRQNGEAAEYRLHDLKRFDGSDVDDFVESLLDSISDDPFVGRTVCVANATEQAGKNLRKALDEHGLSSIAVRVTGGDSSKEQGRALSFGDEGAQVSEHEIVSTIEDLYRSGRLDTSILKSDEPTALVQGLEDYHVRSSEAGEALDEKDVEPSRSAANSDLVLAAGAACWLADQNSFDPTEHLAGDPPPVRKAKREMRPDTVKPNTR